MVPRVRRTGAILYLVMLAFVAFTLGNTFRQTMVIIAVLGWISVAALTVYMVLFKNMKFTLFKEPPQEATEVATFEDGDRVIVGTDAQTGDNLVVVEKN